MGVNSPLDRDDAFAEMRAVRNPNSRRGQTSITHLLNYTTPRPVQDHSFHPRPHRRHPTWGQGSGYHAVDKARYVHANYRFVVRPEASYTGQAADADLYLEWPNVMQVIASSESQAASCPICLSEPVAPRMARCGHIFCLPCLIRFMNTTADDDGKAVKVAKWKKCPICEDSVYMQEVRPVRFYSGQESSLPRPGDDVVLRLMARKATSSLALPREGGAEVINASDDVPWHFAANVLDYARIMKGTKEYMTEQYDEEIAALLRQEKEDESLFGQDGEWTQRAIKAVKSLQERIADILDVNAATAATNHVSKPMSDSDFYFYSTPPHLYLSPLDIRILKTKYGSFSSFPSTLLPTVEHISTGHLVDDALRKRAKYLGHLPYGCVISFLECDWTDIVPEETLSTFASDIAKRRKRNKDKAAQEERERIDAERVEAAALHSSAGISIPHRNLMEDRPPAMDMSEFQPLNGASTTPPDDRIGFNTLASMSTSPTGERTVWGTVAVGKSPDLTATTLGGRDDGWLNEAELLSNADLSMQLDAIHIAEQEDAKPEANTSTAATGGGGGKKKKKQKITLMSTGGRRGF